MPDQAELVTVTQKRYRCRHIHASGSQCGSPALRNEPFCYHHHTTRRPKAATRRPHTDEPQPFDLPLVEDRASALAAASRILQLIAANDIEPARAGKLLYNLQLITKLLPRESASEPDLAAPPPTVLVTEIVEDEVHGLIASQTEMPSTPQAASPTPSVFTRSVEHSTKCAPCQTKSDVGIPIPPTNPVILSDPELVEGESKDPDKTHTTSTAQTISPPDLLTADSRSLKADSPKPLASNPSRLTPLELRQRISRSARHGKR